MWPPIWCDITYTIELNLNLRRSVKVARRVRLRNVASHGPAQNARWTALAHARGRLAYQAVHTDLRSTSQWM